MSGPLIDHEQKLARIQLASRPTTDAMAKLFEGATIVFLFAVSFLLVGLIRHEPDWTHWAVVGFISWAAMLGGACVLSIVSAVIRQVVSGRLER